MAAKKKKKARAPKKASRKASKGKKTTAAKAKKGAKKTARKAKKSSRKSVKAAARKAPARAPKKKATGGEGDYAASRRFLKDEAAFVKKHKADIPAMGKIAEKALEGPEGNELREAEASAAARSRDTF